MNATCGCPMTTGGAISHLPGCAHYVLAHQSAAADPAWYVESLGTKAFLNRMADALERIATALEVANALENYELVRKGSPR